jgi:hypothetical protein
MLQTPPRKSKLFQQAELASPLRVTKKGLSDHGMFCGRCRIPYSVLAVSAVSGATIIYASRLTPTMKGANKFRSFLFCSPEPARIFELTAFGKRSDLLCDILKKGRTVEMPSVPSGRAMSWSCATCLLISVPVQETSKRLRFLICSPLPLTSKESSRLPARVLR